jgi:hypothetical protein
MKKIILTILLLLIFVSTSFSQPFPKKKYWYGFGFIYSSPQKERDFGKFYKSGFEGNIYFRTVMRENFEFGLSAEFGLFPFDQQNFEKEKSIDQARASEPPQYIYDVDYKTKRASSFSIYQDLYMNALPKFSKDLFFSAGVGFYRLVSPEIQYRIFSLGEWHEWNSISSLTETKFGFNYGINYDHRVYKNTRLCFGLRFHQVIFPDDLLQFLKFKLSVLF